MSTPFTLPAPSGGSIHGRIDEPAAPGPQPTVVICHGFKGFMDWGFFPALAEHLAEGGFLTVRFNFSGSGMEPGEDRATDLDGFRRNTFSKELEDLDAVLAALLGDGGTDSIAAGRADPEALGLFGHSRGGGVALLGATQGQHAERISALVTWASVATYDRFDEETKATWRREGVLPVLNSRTGQEMPLGLGLLEDLEQNPDLLDVESAAAEVGAPWLILHGENDESVPVMEAHRLHRRSRDSFMPVQLETVPNTGHTFGAQHPFTGPTPELIRAMDSTRSWFRQYLS